MSLPPVRFAVLSLLLVSSASLAEAPAGLSFSHHDWELACDNTRTCRAAGYQSDEGEMPPVSVLLTREAGPGKSVRGRLMLGHYDSDAPVARTAPTLRIGDRDVGTVALKGENVEGELTSAQVDALLAALRKDSAIAFVAGDLRWQLSDRGASAVLLKMDEFQGRLGTSGALARKGSADEASVLPAVPAPIVVVASRPVTSAADLALAGDAALRAAVLATTKEDECSAQVPGVTDADDEDDVSSWGVERLTADTLLVWATCWTGAYNTGNGYWVVGDKAPYTATLVTTKGSDYANGEISAAHKGRGLGDCWSSDTWSWNGKAFVHTASATTGQCKLVAAGGAWELPTIVTTVKPSKL